MVYEKFNWNNMPLYSWFEVTNFVLNDSPSNHTADPLNHLWFQKIIYKCAVTKHIAVTVHLLYFWYTDGQHMRFFSISIRTLTWYFCFYVFQLVGVNHFNICFSSYEYSIIRVLCCIYYIVTINSHFMFLQWNTNFIYRHNLLVRSIQFGSMILINIIVHIHLLLSLHSIRISCGVGTYDECDWTK